MKKKNNNTLKNKENLFASFLKNSGKYIKKNYAYLIVFILGFLSVSFINFCKVSTTESVASFIMDDFEIGQISDRTIVAEKTIHFRRESDFCLLYVFVIENRKPLEYHLGCINGTKVKNILRSIDYLVKKNYFRALNRLPCGMLRDETLIN